MRIMLFVTGLGLGGAEKVTCELADILYDLGHQISIVYFTGELITRPKNNITVYWIPLNIYSLLIFPYMLMRLVNQWRPEVIHAHMFHANIIARFVKFLSRRKIRVICSSHSNYEGGRLRMMLYALTENLCDAHTNVSFNAARALMKAGAVRNREIIVVYNGINIKDYLIDKKYNEIRSNFFREKFNLNQDAKIILTIGRIDTPKDYPNLLNAFKLVCERNLNTYLFIVGNGPKKDEIVLLANNLGIINNVIFMGLRNDIPRLLYDCNLFVSSSAWEGFGLAILEAMVCGKPIVATSTDGAKELLDAKYLVCIQSPVELANKILEVLEHDITYIKYSGIEKFDWVNISKKWLCLYCKEK